MTQKTLFVFLLPAIALTACADQGSLDPGKGGGPIGMYVSDPGQPGSNIRGNLAASILADDNLTYISAAPNTLPAAARAQIVNRTHDSEATVVAIVDGGFDPVAVTASAGDSIEIAPFESGQSFTPIFVKVPSKRPPAIVRAKPPKGRTDVALNIIVTIVFTEPVNPQTVNALSVELLQGSRSVGGVVTLKSNGWEAEFKPNQPLDSLATYTIAVSRDIRDADGDALESAYSSTFVTGKAGCEPSMPTCHFDETGSVTGTLVEISARGRSPLGNASVIAWGRRPDGSDLATMTSRTDDSGRFGFAVSPRSTIYFRGVVPGLDQPCGTYSVMQGSSASVEIELVSLRTPWTGTSDRGPLIHGFVQELIPDIESGGLPNQRAIAVPGARLYFESPSGVVTMTTTSAENGEFSFCSAPPSTSQTVIAAKAGFAPKEIDLALGGTPHGEMGFILTRSPPP